MPGIFHISDAAAIGLHAAVYLAARPDRLVSAREMAVVLGASEAHLAKVLRRLGKAGLTRAARGPRGGSTLSRPAEAITLLEVYEAIEGPFEPTMCLLGAPVCNGRKRILGNLLGRLNGEFERYMSTTALADVRAVYGEDGDDA